MKDGDSKSVVLGRFSEDWIMVVRDSWIKNGFVGYGLVLQGFSCKGEVD
jgi:hypothetical protein